MILAAGRGERLRPLTDTIPKPLVQVGELSLIEWHIKRLQQSGINEIVINISYLADQIKNMLGDGKRYAVHLHYSEEPETAFETGGGIVQALPLLGDKPFVVINGDIWTDFQFNLLSEPKNLAHLILVDNPSQHPSGDFILNDNLVSDETAGDRFTFSGIGVYRPELFAGYTPGKRFPLAPILKNAMQSNQVTGEHYKGQWYDIGSIDRLQQLRKQLEGSNI